jgi:membrane protein
MGISSYKESHMSSLVRSIKKFSNDDMAVYAAALSYQLLFSIFPFMIFFLALLGLLNITELFDWLLKQAQTMLPGPASDLVTNIVEQIRSGAGGALSFGAVVGLWSASSVVRMTMHALNVVYEVEDPAVWKKFPLSILYTVLLAVLVIAAAALMLMGPRLAAWVAKLVGLGDVFITVWTWARIPVGVVLLVLVAVLVYYLFPNTGQPFRLITPGALIAVIVWVVATLAFSWYVANFASYNAVYGSLAGVIVLLLYFFISAAILLLGAELNSELYHQTFEGEGPEEGAAEDDMEA